jgi:predicted ABC-type ATPase
LQQPLPHVALAIERVRLRVSQGGHAIAEDVIRRRYLQGWTNFQELYRPMADEWQLFDASGLPPRLIDSGRKT